MKWPFKSRYVALLERINEDQAKELAAKEETIRSLLDRIVHITTGAGLQVPGEQPAPGPEEKPGPRNVEELCLQLAAESEKKEKERYEEMARNSRFKSPDVDFQREVVAVAPRVKAGTNGQ